MFAHQKDRSKINHASMMSSPQLIISTPWIEDLFVYASSFHPPEVNDGELAHENGSRLAEGSAVCPMGPPSQDGKITRVVRRGGDFQRCQNGKRAGPPPCPPYLVLDDGKHSAVAFLSPETLASIVSGRNGNARPMEEKSLIKITGFTVSTILQCTSVDFAVHEKIVQELSSSAPTSHQHMRRRIDSQLLMCLYLQ